MENNNYYYYNQYNNNVNPEIINVKTVQLNYKPCLSPNTIYTIPTGRIEKKKEQFVNIYDSNFGGLLGTQMGLNKVNN